ICRMSDCYPFSSFARFLHPAVLLCWAALRVAVAPAQASGTVTNCTESGLSIALRGGGFVTFACDTVFPITSTLVIDRTVVLDGTGHSAGISGNQSTNVGRLFLVRPGASLTLRNLTITGVRLAGSNGTAGNSGQPGLGGAIFNDHGFVILDGCTFSDNQV